jgi:hypothetical protein
VPAQFQYTEKPQAWPSLPNHLKSAPVVCSRAIYPGQTRKNHLTAKESAFLKKCRENKKLWLRFITYVKSEI